MGVLVEIPVGPQLGQVGRDPGGQRPTGASGGEQPIGQGGRAGPVQLDAARRRRGQHPLARLLHLREGAVEVEQHRPYLPTGRAPTVGVGYGAGRFGMIRHVVHPTDPSDRPAARPCRVLVVGTH
ncbi:hypothetical protein GCM10029963_06870 [Micromonospora andamanensis]